MVAPDEFRSRYGDQIRSVLDAFPYTDDWVQFRQRLEVRSRDWPGNLVIWTIYSYSDLHTGFIPAGGNWRTDQHPKLPDPLLQVKHAPGTGLSLRCEGLMHAEELLLTGRLLHDATSLEVKIYDKGGPSGYSHVQSGSGRGGVSIGSRYGGGGGGKRYTWLETIDGETID